MSNSVPKKRMGAPATASKPAAVATDKAKQPGKGEGIYQLNLTTVQQVTRTNRIETINDTEYAIHKWDVSVSLNNCSRPELFIRRVEFFLHASFGEGRMTQTIKRPPYRISQEGYGGFDIIIQIHYKKSLLDDAVEFGPLPQLAIQNDLVKKPHPPAKVSTIVHNLHLDRPKESIVTHAKITNPGPKFHDAIQESEVSFKRMSTVHKQKKEKKNKKQKKNKAKAPDPPAPVPVVEIDGGPSRPATPIEVKKKERKPIDDLVKKDKKERKRKSVAPPVASKQPEKKPKADVVDAPVAAVEKHVAPEAVREPLAFKNEVVKEFEPEKKRKPSGDKVVLMKEARREEAEKPIVKKQPTPPKVKEVEATGMKKPIVPAAPIKQPVQEPPKIALKPNLQSAKEERRRKKKEKLKKKEAEQREIFWNSLAEEKKLDRFDLLKSEVKNLCSAMPDAKASDKLRKVLEIFVYADYETDPVYCDSFFANPKPTSNQTLVGHMQGKAQLPETAKVAFSMTKLRCGEVYRLAELLDVTLSWREESK